MNWWDFFELLDLVLGAVTMILISITSFINLRYYYTNEEEETNENAD